MTEFMTDINIQKVDDWTWRIPKFGDMRVDGIVYSSEKMMNDIRKDQSLQQVVNVATLPGIVRASYAMPDIHWGYGFPIGGVAAFDDKTGVVSPGGVGYDISCLPETSMISSSYGYYRPMLDYVKSWGSESLACLDQDSNSISKTSIKGFLTRESDGYLRRLVTESGHEIRATCDHPFLTPNGMVPLEDVAVGDEVAVNHFEGVPYEKPSDEIIVDENKIVEILKALGKEGKGNAIPQILKDLGKRNVLPIRYNSPHFPELIKIAAFLFGDGALYIEKKRNKYMNFFYGEPDDLEEIRKDVAKAGFKPSKIYSRFREHKITTNYGEQQFSRDEYSFKVVSSSFGVIMAALGVPVGNKTISDYGVPKWLFKAPLWQKRLFLASFFGAEMSSPSIISGRKVEFFCPTLGMSKRESHVDSGRKFLLHISFLLKEFDIETGDILLEENFYQRKDGFQSCRLRLVVSNTIDNLSKFWARVGFEYHKGKKTRSMLAVAYLKYKQKHLIWRANIAELARQIHREYGLGGRRTFGLLKGWAPNLRFVERSMYGSQTAIVRVGENILSFKEYCDEYSKGLKNSGCIWERVIAIDDEPYFDKVYDFTVDHPAHNFIADGFVVSNCGVRLLKTHLVLDDVKDKIKGLVRELFKEIPTGVGAKRRDFKLSSYDERQVLEKGAKWAVGKGFGTAEDLEHIEDNGTFRGASYDAVSKRALERGRPQLGTLGSGNHFCEIGYVDEIYDPAVADAIGLYKGQITIFVHTGSRGFGHQVCSDYISVMLKASQKYGIHLPDKQLCCAPIGSPEGEAYISAMAAAANYAMANRQMITHWVMQSFERYFGMGPKDLGISIVYDVSHNTAKFEEYMIGGASKRLLVHRKGATRSFPGQPVLIPGDMGRYSFVLVGTEKAMQESFGSTCHGAGRLMSRHQAKKVCRGRDVVRELAEKGITVMGATRGTIVEEVSDAYKDVVNVVDVCAGAGISKKAARLRPIGVIKG